MLYVALAAIASACAKAPSPQAELAVHAATIDRYCLDCHSFAERAGDLSLERVDLANVAAHAETLEGVIRKLRAGMMPPADQPRPDVATVQSLIGWLERSLDAEWNGVNPPPGMHRLNRVEYRNAIRDLLALDVDTTAMFPADDVSRGFDNQAGTLGLSPALLEAYLTAAGRISRLVVGSETDATQVVYRVPEDKSQNDHIAGLPFGTRGGLLIRHNFPADGDYQLRIVPIPLGNMGASRPFGDVRGEQLVVYVDGEQVAQIDWDEEFSGGGGGNLDYVPRVDVAVTIEAGPREIGVTFLANNFAPLLDLNHAFERTTIETGGLPGFSFYPHIGNVRIDGPFDVRPSAVDTPSRRAVFTCMPDNAAGERACAEQIIARMARLAYRGQHADSDLALLMDFYTDGHASGGFEAGIEMVLHRLLVDPKFLYRFEDYPDHVAEGENYPVDPLALASRLSFFLWSSIPDDGLLSLAEQGLLDDPAVLRSQVSRMLDDPRSLALTENFAGQWLALRDLEGHVPTPQDFPDFDHTLRLAFQRETSMLFDSLVREDRSIVELLTADYTFLDERLARHYGIAGVRGSHFRRVELGDAYPERHGLFGKGSFLTVTSQPGRTSPVMRGDWVLANVIGVPPPPPPPDVPEIEPPGPTERPLTIREQYERHRNDPACMGCHVLMDPIGFALEAYDGIGRHRSVDLYGNPIDTADVMYDGTPINGVADLTAFMLRYEDQFVTTFVEKLVTYALGRGLEYNDMPLVRAIVREGERDRYSVQSLIAAVALSDAFRMNTRLGGEGGSELTATIR